VALNNKMNKAGGLVRSMLSPQGRRAGVLQPVSGLAGTGPIGDLDGAIPFIEWLAEAGMGLWQVLPLVPTNPEGSPYSSWSTLSGNPDLVGLEGCIEAGLLPPSARMHASHVVCYEETRVRKRPLVLEAARALVEQENHPWSGALDAFVKGAPWATEAALFYALKDAYGQAPWWEWPPAVRLCEPQELARLLKTYETAVTVWRAALFLFEHQWSGVRQEARHSEIRIIGDMPIYVDLDSVDVWRNQRLFLLTESGRPRSVAGVPPDAYSETGQLWGNPLFDWEAMEADGFLWWITRVRRALEHCDALRIDHFIGFSRYWAVPSDSDDARVGEWRKGPGLKLFQALKDALGTLPLIAEDLGDLDEETARLRDELGLPGMRVLVFGFDGSPKNPHHPTNVPRHAVVYPTTHDTSTARGWWEEHDTGGRADLTLGVDGESAADALIERALSSEAFWSIIPTQDLLRLGGAARMNRPGTSKGNWLWRQSEGSLTTALAFSVRERLLRTQRLTR
jgi:4-alpha-glucanotransferase